MGGSPSRPPPPPPPVVRRDPRPARPPLEGLSIGTSQGCKAGKCVLGIAQGISASSVKIYRQYGDISREECDRLLIDIQKVEKKEMSLDEFQTNALAGRYYEPQENGFCAQLLTTEEDMAKDRNIGAFMNNTKWRRPKIRKMTDSGGFSSLTKVIMKPSIPFKITWDGREISVETMTLFHPSPIRIENVQHDAMLTLNDPSDANVNFVALIPLKGAAIPGPSGNFIGKIASYLPGVLSPNPASGQYEAIDVPTGNDWNLSKMFPGKPENGRTVVTTGIYAWQGMPAMEEYLKVQTPSLIHYGWRPVTSRPRPTYVMLDQAIPVGSFDLQTIRMLPVTESGEAIDIPAADSISYKPGDCTATSASPLGGLASALTTSRERFNLDEGEDACDPFANMPNTGPDPQIFVTILVTMVSALAVFIGVYFAMKYVTTWKGDVFKMAGEFLGRQVSKLSEMKPKIPGTPSKARTFMSSLASATGSTELDKPEPEPEPEKKEDEGTFSMDNPLIPKEKREFIEKKIAEKKKKEEEKKAAAEKKEEEEKAAEEKRKADEKAAEEKRKADEKAAEEKRKADEKAAEEEKKVATREEAARRGFVRSNATRQLITKPDEDAAKKLLEEERIKYLRSTPDITKEEQKELQKLTGEVRPTKAEKREAAGTGLFKFDTEGKPIKKRVIAPEPEEDTYAEEEVAKLERILDEADAVKKKKEEEKKKADEIALKYNKMTIADFEEGARNIKKRQEEEKKKADEIALKYNKMTIADFEEGDRNRKLKLLKEKIEKQKLELAEKLRRRELAAHNLKIAKENAEKSQAKREQSARTLPAVPPPEIKKEEEAKKDVIDARLDSDRIARDLAAAQSRLRQSQSDYATAIRKGKGRTRRRVVQ